MNIEMNIENKQKMKAINDRISAYEAKIRDLVNERNKIVLSQRKEKEHE